VRIAYYGQACTLIEAGGRKILADPWLTEGAYFGTWFHAHLLGDAAVSPSQLAGAGVDYLFLSHEHQDHVDAATLREFPRDIPVLICKFPNDRFRRYLEGLGLVNIRELPSGETLDLGGDLKVTIFSSAEYTNDSALLVEGDGSSVFNETDCKISYADLERVRGKGIDIGFYMFSGANWYPMMYDYPEDVRAHLTRRRRASLLKSFVQRVKLTRPRVAVPSAGPCMVLDPDLLWLNWKEQGIFIDPEEAVAALKSAHLPAEPLYMAASDVWDSRTGFERRSPDAFRASRRDYILDASERMAASIREKRAGERPAGKDLPQRVVEHFDAKVGAQTEEVRRRIGTCLALEVTGPHGGQWTVDFNSAGPRFVREGLDPHWTYRVQVEDKLLYPFVSGQMEFLEDLFLSLRVRLARRPDHYNEPLYHFLYDPDPARLRNWYAAH